MPEVIAITGCAATGKRTAGSAIARAIGARFVDYLEYLKDKGAVTFEDGEAVIEERKAREAFKSLKGAHVISGIYALNYIDPRSVRLTVVLRVHPRVLFYRYIMRGYPLEKAVENAMAEYLDVCLSMALQKTPGRVAQMDATFCSPDQIAARTIKAVNGELVFDEVNWLSEINGPDDLKRIRFHG